MTLIHKLELDIFPLHLHAKIQVHMSVSPARRVRQRDTQTMPKLLFEATIPRKLGISAPSHTMLFHCYMCLY